MLLSIILFLCLFPIISLISTWHIFGCCKSKKNKNNGKKTPTNMNEKNKETSPENSVPSSPGHSEPTSTDPSNNPSPQRRNTADNAHTSKPPKGSNATMTTKSTFSADNNKSVEQQSLYDDRASKSIYNQQAMSPQEVVEREDKKRVMCMQAGTTRPAGAQDYETLNHIVSEWDDDEKSFSHKNNPATDTQTNTQTTSARAAPDETGTQLDSRRPPNQKSNNLADNLDSNTQTTDY